MMKACKDCKHIFREHPVGWDWCDCPKSKKENTTHDYVNGISKPSITRYMCSSFRELDYPETCGPDAKYFEPKEEKQPNTSAGLKSSSKNKHNISIIKIIEFIIKVFFKNPPLWLVLFLFLYTCCFGCHAGVRRDNNIMRVEIKTSAQDEIVKECYSEQFNKWDDGSPVMDPTQIGGCARFIEYTLIPFGTKSYNCKIYTLNKGTEFDKMYALVHELKHCIDDYNELGFKTQITPMWSPGEKSGE